MTDYYLLFAFEKHDEDRHIIKAAFKHIMTGDIVLTTASNTIPERAYVDSIVSGWYVYKADMIAPPCFWKAFSTLL